MEATEIRNKVCSMLIKTLEQDTLSHIVLQDLYEDKSISDKDLAFIKRLYSGTLEKLVWIDYVLDQFSKVPVRKMKPVIRSILRMSVYQLHFMDSVPAYTCINEAVKLTRKRGFHNLTGFVNGVLRHVDRQAHQLDFPEHVKACAPKWIYDLVTKQYGKPAADAFFQAIQNSPSETRIRICESPENRTKKILETLTQDGCTVQALLPEYGAYAISGFQRLSSLTAFQNGDIIIQDPSSILAAQAALIDNPVPDLVLDVCAAPGGKSLYIAQHSPSSKIIARDLTEYKAKKIRENIRRLHISNIEVQVCDARQEDPAMNEKADVVIADLPCSGLGVIARKPDILHRLKPEDLTSLAALQQQILNTVQAYVKKGGILVYSTCTINHEENQENTRWFLQHHPYELLQEQQYLPGRDPYDGFYIARFRRIDVNKRG